MSLNFEITVDDDYIIADELRLDFDYLKFPEPFKIARKETFGVSRALIQSEKHGRTIIMQILQELQFRPDPTSLTALVDKLFNFVRDLRATDERVLVNLYELFKIHHQVWASTHRKPIEAVDKPKVIKGSSFGDGGCCAICLAELCDNARPLGRLPCQHLYHLGCIERWLIRSNKCPLCRSPVALSHIFGCNC